MSTNDAVNKYITLIDWFKNISFLGTSIESVMEEIEYVRSNKGGPKIIHSGYMYTVHKNKKCGGIRWRCAQRSLNCKVRMYTKQLNFIF